MASFLESDSNDSILYKDLYYKGKVTMGGPNSNNKGIKLNDQQKGFVKDFVAKHPLCTPADVMRAYPELKSVSSNSFGSFFSRYQKQAMMQGDHFGMDDALADVRNGGAVADGTGPSKKPKRKYRYIVC